MVEFNQNRSDNFFRRNPVPVLTHNEISVAPCGTASLRGFFCAVISMKRIILILALTGLAMAQNPYMKSASGGKVKQTVTFDGKTYILKFVDRTKVVDLNEYYLQQEEPENWTRMVSVAVYNTTGTPVAMAKNMERSLLATHPDAPHKLVGNPDESQALFVCVNWAGNPTTGAEFDVFRLLKTPRGVLVYQASLHPYQAKIGTEEYGALKDRWQGKDQDRTNFPTWLCKCPSGGTAKVS